MNEITVKIKGSSQKGKITLSYDSPEKLEELCAKLGQVGVEV